MVRVMLSIKIKKMLPKTVHYGTSPETGRGIEMMPFIFTDHDHFIRKEKSLTAYSISPEFYF